MHVSSKWLSNYIAQPQHSYGDISKSVWYDFINKIEFHYLNKLACEDLKDDMKLPKVISIVGGNVDVGGVYNQE